MPEVFASSCRVEVSFHLFIYKALCGADSTCKITFFLLNMQAFFLPIAPILLHHPAHQHFVFRKRAMSFVGFMFCARPLHHLCMGLAQVVQSLRAMRATAMHHSRCWRLGERLCSKRIGNRHLRRWILTGIIGRTCLRQNSPMMEQALVQGANDW